MAKTLSAEEFAVLAGVSGSAVRRWARDGFPGATQVPSSKNRPMWVFEARSARRFAADVQKVNATFRLIGKS